MIMQPFKINKTMISNSKLLLLIILMISTYATYGQVNYVRNGGFELYSRCPYAWDQIKFATGWQPIDTVNHPPVDSFGNGNCTPEYCNVCAPKNAFASVPDNGFFYHYPHTGNGMAQVTMFFDESYAYAYHRDYLQGHLFKSLTAGQSYCVTFYVILDQQVRYAVNHIGAYLDNGIIDTTQNCGLAQTTHIPQVQTLNVVNDTLTWTKIEGSFVATGKETYITIGNFYDKAHSTYVIADSNNGGSNIALYLVDDVSVVESDIPAYAGRWMYKTKKDSLFIGRNEIVPDCMWYRNGVLIDTVHAGFWVKDTVNTVYVVKQSICGNVKYDTAWVNIANMSVGSVGSESVYRIYPNPASKEIMIQAPNNMSTVGMVVYDVSGRVFMKQEVQFKNGSCQVPISLSTGVYIVELVDENGVKSIQRLSVL